MNDRKNSFRKGIVPLLAAVLLSFVTNGFAADKAQELKAIEKIKAIETTYCNIFIEHDGKEYEHQGTLKLINDKKCLLFFTLANNDKISMVVNKINSGRYIDFGKHKFIEKLRKQTSCFKKGKPIRCTFRCGGGIPKTKIELIKEKLFELTINPNLVYRETGFVCVATDKFIKQNKQENEIQGFFGLIGASIALPLLPSEVNNSKKQESNEGLVEQVCVDLAILSQLSREVACQSKVKAKVAKQCIVKIEHAQGDLSFATMVKLKNPNRGFTVDDFDEMVKTISKLKELQANLPSFTISDKPQKEIAIRFTMVDEPNVSNFPVHSTGVQTIATQEPLMASKCCKEACAQSAKCGTCPGRCPLAKHVKWIPFIGELFNPPKEIKNSFVQDKPYSLIWKARSPQVIATATKQEKNPKGFQVFTISAGCCPFGFGKGCPFGFGKDCPLFQHHTANVGKVIASDCQKNQTVNLSKVWVRNNKNKTQIVNHFVAQNHKPDHPHPAHHHAIHNHAHASDQQNRVFPSPAAHRTALLKVQQRPQVREHQELIHRLQRENAELQKQNNHLRHHAEQTESRFEVAKQLHLQQLEMVERTAEIGIEKQLLEAKKEIMQLKQQFHQEMIQLQAENEIMKMKQQFLEQTIELRVENEKLKGHLERQERSRAKRERRERGVKRTSYGSPWDRATTVSTTVVKPDGGTILIMGSGEYRSDGVTVPADPGTVIDGGVKYRVSDYRPGRYQGNEKYIGRQDKKAYQLTPKAQQLQQTIEGLRNMGEEWQRFWNFDTATKAAVQPCAEINPDYYNDPSQENIYYRKAREKSETNTNRYESSSDEQPEKSRYQPTRNNTNDKQSKSDLKDDRRRVFTFNISGTER